MSASSIPNLLALRGSRGGRGRGRSRGGHPSSRAGPDHDEVIQGTDTDAAVSRLSAVLLGYLDDPFAQHFVTNTSGPATRRLPIINRGTYTRTTALDRLVRTFLQKCNSEEKQIISLGAGTDTRSLRLFAPSTAAKGLIYHEIDFFPICTRKLRIVQGNPILRRVLGDPVADEGGEHWECALPNGSYFCCHGVDLRELVHKDVSALIGLRTDIPTLLISECCLCYLDTSTAADVVRWFTDKIPSLAVTIYEPIKPDDSFGQMMVSNLAARRIRMPTLETYKEVGDQESRLRQAGFEEVKVMTVEDIWEQWVSEKEKERVNNLEGLDEVEEWKLLAGHYIVGWASRGSGLGGWISGT